MLRSYDYWNAEVPTTSLLLQRVLAVMILINIIYKFVKFVKSKKSSALQKQNKKSLDRFSSYKQIGTYHFTSINIVQIWTFVYIYFPYFYKYTKIHYFSYKMFNLF